MNTFELLTGNREEALSTTRQVFVPSQPANTPSDQVYLGAGVGFAAYVGEKPQAGDLATVQGVGTGRPVASTGQRVPAMRVPTLGGVRCRCKCPSAAGVAFYLAFAKQTGVVHAIDAVDSTLRQLIGRTELGYASNESPSGPVFTTRTASVTVDPDAPHDLYVLDDRRNFRSHGLLPPTAPSRGYFTVLRFEVVAGAYVFADTVNLTDPFPVTVPISEPDLPAVPGNCLSVIEVGTPAVTVTAAPARYLKQVGATYVMRALTLNGNPYAVGLRGNIARVPQRPASSGKRYVLGTVDNLVYQVIEFDVATDAISRVIPLATVAPAKQLVALCNRLVVIEGVLDSFGSTIEV